MCCVEWTVCCVQRDVQYSSELSGRCAVLCAEGRAVKQCIGAHFSPRVSYSHRSVTKTAQLRYE